MDATGLAGLLDDLSSFLKQRTPDLGRSERRGWAIPYLRGLRLDGDRKSASAMAQRLAVVDRFGRDDELGLE